MQAAGLAFPGVLVKEFSVSYHNIKETILFTVDTYKGNLN